MSDPKSKQQKQGRETLGVKVEQLSEALEIAQVGYWEFNPETRLFTFSDELYALFGTTAEAEGGYQVSADQFAQKFMPSGASIAGLEMQKAVENQDEAYSRQIETRALRADGTVWDMLVRFRAIKDASSKTIKIVGANQDITERKQAEEIIGKQNIELARREQKLRQNLEKLQATQREMTGVSDALQQQTERINLVQQVAGIGLWDIDLGTRSVKWNDMMYEILGLPRVLNPPTLKQLIEMYHPDDRAEYTQNIERLIERGERLDQVVRVVKPNDEIIFVHNVGLPVRDSQGKIIEIFGLVQDITERKRSEAKLAKQAGDLATVAEISTTILAISEAQQMLQSVVDLTKAGFDLYHAHIYLLDETGKALVLAAGAGEAGREMTAAGWRIPLNREQSLVARAARTRQEIIVNDVRTDAGFLPNPLLPEARSEVAVPMIVGNQLLGVLDVQSAQVDHFIDEDVRIQTTLAAQVAVALQNTRSLERAEQTLKELHVVTRRLTREGWEAYLAKSPTASGFSYDLQQISPIDLAASPTDEKANHGYISKIERSLQVQGEAIGQLTLAEPQNLADDAGEIIEVVVERLSAHLENLRLVEQTERALAETEILYTASNRLAQATNPAELLDAVSDYAHNLGANAGQLFYIDNDPQGNPEWVEVMAEWQVEGQGIPPGSRFYLPEFTSARLWLSQPETPALVSDTMAHEMVDPTLRELFVQTQVGANALLPLNIKGRWVGLLSFAWKEPYTFTERDQRIFNAIAQRMTPAVDAARAFAQAQETLAETRILYETSRALDVATNLDEILRGTLATLNQNEIAVGADSVTLSIVEVDENGEPEWTDIAAWWFADGREPPYPAGTRFPIKDVSLTKVWTEEPSSPIFLSDTRTDEQLDELTRSWYVGAGTLALVLMPLALAGRWVGLLSISWTEPQPFSERDRRIYRTVMRQFATAVDNQRLAEENQTALLEQRQARSLLDKRVKELNCLNEIGREIAETPAIPGLLQWITERIPPAMAYPAFCKVAIEYDGQLYGVAEAIQLPTQIVNALRVGDEIIGRIYIAYTEKRDFLDEESALLGGIATRVGGYIESRHLFEQMQEALAEVRWLASIVENHPDFIGSGTLDGQALYVNPTGLRLMGLPEDYRVTGMKATDFYPAEDADKLIKEGVPAALKEGSWTAETNLLKADGTTIPVEETIGINYDAQGNPVGFSITMRDVSERKQADLERERLLAELQAAYRQFVQREWSQFLDEQRGGVWHVEYQQSEKGLTTDTSGRQPEMERQPELAGNRSAGEIQVDPKSKIQSPKSKLDATIALRGQPIGALSLEDIDPNRRWTPEEKALVETISEQLAQTIENLRLFGDTQKRAARERLTREITDKMRESPDIDTIIQTGLTELANALGVPRTYVKLTPKPDQLEAAEAEIERARTQLKHYGHRDN